MQGTPCGNFTEIPSAIGHSSLGFGPSRDIRAPAGKSFWILVWIRTVSAYTCSTVGWNTRRRGDPFPTLPAPAPASGRNPPCHRERVGSTDSTTAPRSTVVPGMHLPKTGTPASLNALRRPAPDVLRPLWARCAGYVPLLRTYSEPASPAEHPRVGKASPPRPRDYLVPALLLSGSVSSSQASPDPVKLAGGNEKGPRPEL